MLGAIIGDIVGSRFEFENYRGKDFELFVPACSFTDDTVMSLAVCAAILACKGDYQELSQLAIEKMQQIGRPYPNCGYGGNFYRWIYSDTPQPYDSYGNGAAMRVSGCGFAASSLAQAKDLSYKVTCVSHDHPEGLKGAEAVAVAIFLAKTGTSKQKIHQYMVDHYYALDFTLDEIRVSYEFNETCQDTVPQALQAFFEADSFEETIRNGISIGGDSDTIGAIAGSVAEAFYGVPATLRQKALPYLNKQLKKILKDFEAAFPPQQH